MQKAGMTPMQIIIAGTKNAAVVCNLGSELGIISYTEPPYSLVSIVQSLSLHHRKNLHKRNKKIQLWNIALLAERV